MGTIDRSLSVPVNFVGTLVGAERTHVAPFHRKTRKKIVLQPSSVKSGCCLASTKIFALL